MVYQNTHEKTYLWKYNLEDESLAASASGMASYADLDKRCIIFTIHLYDPKQHDPLCRALFAASETFFTALLNKAPKVTHCGLMSFLDVNGSKFSGADRNNNKTHCHGCLFIPFEINSDAIGRLIHELEMVAHSMDGPSASRDAVKFSIFDRNILKATISDWIGYAQKEATRRETIGTFGIYLPFDLRCSFDKQKAEKIISRRNAIARALESSERFKIYRTPK